MKNNFFLLLFYFLFACTSINEFEVKIEDLKKEGLLVTENKNFSNNNEVELIKKVKTKKVINNLNNWNYAFYNSSSDLKNIFSQSNLSKVEKKNYFAFNKLNNFKKEIIVSNNLIIFIDDYSNLFFLDKSFKIKKKITIHKKKDIKNYPLKFSMLSQGNNLYISDNLGTIFSVDINSFEIKWKKSLNVPFLSNIILQNDDLYLINSNGKLFSINILNGITNWSYDTGSNLIKSYESYKISAFENFLLFSTDFETIYCIDLKKKTIVWDFKITKAAHSLGLDLFKISNLLISENNLYVSSNYGNIFKINLSDGRVLWVNNVFSNSNILINQDTISLVDNFGFFHIFDLSTGKLLFKKNIIKNLVSKNKKLININLNNLFLSANKFYITTNFGYVVVVNSQNLQEIYYKKISNHINSNLVILNKEIYFIGENNLLYIIQ